MFYLNYKKVNFSLTINFFKQAGSDYIIKEIVCLILCLLNSLKA